LDAGTVDAAILQAGAAKTHKSGDPRPRETEILSTKYNTKSKNCVANNKRESLSKCQSLNYHLKSHLH
jgi:hypothetical protein